MKMNCNTILLLFYFLNITYSFIQKMIQVFLNTNDIMKLLVEIICLVIDFNKKFKKEKNKIKLTESFVLDYQNLIEKKIK